MATSSTPLFNVGGIASGLDTNTIISQMLSIEQQPKVRLQQQQTVETARQAALTDVRTRLQNLQTAANGLKDAANWADVQTVESDSSQVGAVRTGGAAAGGYRVAVSRLAQADQIRQAANAATTAASTDTLHIALGAGTATDIPVTAGDSLQTIADRINGASSVRVYATVVNGALYLSGKQTGAANTISVTSDGTLADDLGLSAATRTQTLAAGDAQFSVNGTPLTSTSNVATDAIPGLTLTLKGVTTTDATLTVSAPGPDTDAIQTKVKAFVDQYNSTLDFLNQEVSEQKVAKPQSDADRVKGVLNGDPAVLSIISSLRNSLSDLVTGAPADLQSLAQVGVSTGAAVGSGSLNQDAIAGKLSLDSGKLSDLLNTRFADVKALFTNVTGSYASEGIAQRLDGILAPATSATNGTLQSMIDGEGKRIQDLKDQQAEIDQRLADREAQLRAMFTAMETAMAQAQQAGSALTGQLASLPTPSS